MTKPILAAIGSFIGLCGTTLLISHYEYGNTAWIEGVGGGLAVAFCMFVVPQWKLDREKKQQETKNSSSV